jgi:rhodanese-related sulfurtransferase
MARRGGILLLLAVGWLVVAPEVWAGRDAGSSGLPAPAAAALAGAGEITVIDVRGAPEWARSGVPRGAKEVSLYPRPGQTNVNFVNQVLAAVGGDKSTPIATICATGERSSVARGILLRAGFTAVYDISEGMFGSTSGPGWLRRGLPVEPCRSC